MSVRTYSNPLLLSSHDLPRMLWKTSGESRGASGEERVQGMGCRGNSVHPTL